MVNWTTDEEWQDKGCSATNMRWNLAGPVVWEMISLGLTAGEMLSTNQILTVKNTVELLPYIHLFSKDLFVWCAF